MPHYRRNRLRQETVQRFGQTAGLPLFNGQSKPIPEPRKSRFANAPKSVALATDTKKLGHVAATFDVAELSDKQQKVLDVIREFGPVTNTEIAHRLNWPINCVVGRTFELREFGVKGIPLVVPAGKRKCSITGMVVQTWRVSEV